MTPHDYYFTTFHAATRPATRSQSSVAGAFLIHYLMSSSFAFPLRGDPPHAEQPSFGSRRVCAFAPDVCQGAGRGPFPARRSPVRQHRVRSAHTGREAVLFVLHAA